MSAYTFNHKVAFPQHPPDHPLWRDVNFCPTDVYTDLILPLKSKRPAVVSSRKGAGGETEGAGGAVASTSGSSGVVVGGITKKSSATTTKAKSGQVLNHLSKSFQAALRADGGARAKQNTAQSAGLVPKFEAKGGWSEREDNMLIFQQSDRGRELRISYEDVAEYLGRSFNAVKCRWHAHVKKNQESLSKVKYERIVQEGEMNWAARTPR